MAARFIYGNVTPAQAKAHDEAVFATQLHLLEEMKSQPSSSGVRDYAEAFALISGLIQVPLPPKN